MGNNAIKPWLEVVSLHPDVLSRLEGGAGNRVLKLITPFGGKEMPGTKKKAKTMWGWIGWPLGKLTANWQSHIENAALTTSEHEEKKVGQ